LRGILAVYVVLHHARWLLWVGHSAWTQSLHPFWATGIVYASAILRYGHEAVMVFFALSGFFIHLRVAQKLAAGTDPGVDTMRFLQRRAHRLLAPYFLALLLTIVLDTVGRQFFPVLYAAQTGDALLDSLFARKDYSVEAVVSAFCLVPAALGRDFGTNGPLWSLAFEVIYYLLYPIWCRLRLWNAAVAYGVVPVLCLALTLRPAPSFLLQVFVHYPIWLAGAALAEWSCRRRVPTDSAALAGLMLAGAFALHHCVRLPVAGLLVNLVLGTSAVWCFAVLPANWTRCWWHRTWEFLGIRSYTIYIVHFPILTLIASAAITMRGKLPQSGWLAVAGAVVTLGLCLLVFEVCEKHFIHERLRADSA
jgi:peptidoglycan/LPS O-acetylase OafA/YrhL